jgi:protein gp37
MTTTNISWTDVVWNPVTGCTPVSSGCAHCYARLVAERFWGDRKFSDVRCHPERLDAPLHWRKPRRVFVNSMSDLFHEKVPDDFIVAVFDAMDKCPQHTFQILTKRPARMRNMCGRPPDADMQWYDYKNKWLGVSVENQQEVHRMGILRELSAAVRFVSFEPLLGPINLDMSTWKWLDWVIVGAESGPGRRPMQIEWLTSIIDQCRAAKVPVWVKQDGGPRPGAQGRIPSEYWVKEQP